MSAAHVVVDLGFGDAGKGSVVDFLVRDRAAGLVVRWHGGAQAGHRVVAPDGRAHVFAQLGAGSFVPGTATHLAKGFVLDPPALLVEAARLASLGVPDVLSRLTIDPDVLVITPFARAANRLREIARGDAAHGSCGIGFGETQRLALEFPETRITLSDLYRPAALPRALRRLRGVVREELAPLLGQLASVPSARPEIDALESDAVLDEWIASLAPLLQRDLMQDDTRIARALVGPDDVVFEGAQGVLLDEWRGFHPHTTWSTCTSHGADALLDRIGFAGPRRRLGLMRSYQTRHGQGPMPTTQRELTRLSEAANGDTGWQGHFRRGWLDMTLMRYALEVSPVDALVVTHLDAVDESFQLATTLTGPEAPGLVARSVDGRTRLLPSADLEDLDRQERLTRWLEAARPELTRAPDVDSLLEQLELELSPPVTLVSSGPTANDKRWRSAPGEVRPRPRRSSAAARP